VVRDPAEPDDEEAQRVGEELRREVLERLAQVLVGDVGNLDAHDEQRDRDREDAVTERDETIDISPARTRVARCVAVTALKLGALPVCARRHMRYDG
jgi:hypothetical protein